MTNTPVPEDLDPVLAPLYLTDPNALAELRLSLIGAAAAGGMLDIAYRTLDTPVGTLLLAATEQGLVRVAFDIEDHDQVLVALAQRVSPRIMLAPGRLDPVTRQLAEYFDGHRTVFDVPLDLRLVSGFRRAVILHLSEIGYGAKETYSQVAAAAGSPRAVRAVGTACATNPVPVVVPCHRVIRADGSFGGYRGGPAAKRTLLDLESAGDA